VSYHNFHYMDLESCPEDLQQKLKATDWASISPEISKILAGPSFYMRQAQHSHERKLREMLSGFDLTETQFMLLAGLMVMTKSGGAVTQMDLASLFNFDKMLVSKVLRTLEKKCLVVREKHPADSRAKSLVVTTKGLASVDSVLKLVVKFDEDYFSVLDNKDEFIRQLKKIQ